VRARLPAGAPAPTRRFRLVAWLVIACFRLMRWRFTFRGLEHVPREGGAVVVWNHTSHVDFLVVAYAILRHTGRPVRFLAMRELWDHRWLGWVPRFAEAVPVDRGSSRGRASALADAVAALREGHLVMVAPEGTISHAFDLLPFRTGAARMAELADVPLLPAVTWGSHRLVSTGHPMRLRRAWHIPVTVDVGPPVEHRGEPATVVTERLHRTMGELVARAQGTYPDGAPAGAWWVPARLGGAAPTVEEVLTERRRSVPGAGPRPSG
jgi:1-acyl-sn-glycerol-3-phosphate acyltransferase